MSTDDPTGPEREAMPDIDDRDAPAPEENEPVPEDSEGTDVNETLEEVELEAVDKLKTATTVAEKMAASEFIFARARETLKAKALELRKKMEAEPDSPYGLLMGLWNELNDKGKERFLNDHTFLKDVLRKAVTPTPITLGLEFRNFFHRQVLPTRFLQLKHFNPQEVRALVALGVLDCPEALAHTIDGDAVRFLKIMNLGGKVMEFLPVPGAEEAGVVVAGVAKLGSVPAHWAERLLPQVRTEVRSEIEMVPATLAGEHKAMGRGLNPPIKLEEPANNPDHFEGGMRAAG